MDVLFATMNPNLGKLAPFNSSSRRIVMRARHLLVGSPYRAHIRYAHKDFYGAVFVSILSMSVLAQQAQRPPSSGTPRARTGQRRGGPDMTAPTPIAAF